MLEGTSTLKIAIKIKKYKAVELTKYFLQRLPFRTTNESISSPYRDYLANTSYVNNRKNYVSEWKRCLMNAKRLLCVIINETRKRCIRQKFLVNKCRFCPCFVFVVKLSTIATNSSSHHNKSSE